jgi:hypothetical protein
MRWRSPEKGCALSYEFDTKRDAEEALRLPTGGRRPPPPRTDALPADSSGARKGEHVGLVHLIETYSRMVMGGCQASVGRIAPIVVRNS